MTWRRLDPRGRRAFVRHLVEMVLAMVAGMVVLGGLTELGLSLAGRGIDDVPTDLRVALMGFDMTAGMVAWMAYRRHPGPRIAEMAAAMAVPTLGTIALHAAGAIPSDGALAVQHVAMVPAMLGAMWWRRDHYAEPARAGRLPRRARR